MLFNVYTLKVAIWPAFLRNTESSYQIAKLSSICQDLQINYWNCNLLSHCKPYKTAIKTCLGKINPISLWFACAGLHLTWINVISKVGNMQTNSWCFTWIAWFWTWIARFWSYRLIWNLDRLILNMDWLILHIDWLK